MIAVMWGYDWGWWLAMSIMMVLFWGLVIGAMLVLVRYLGGSPQGGLRPPDGGRSRAEELLAERFARGEIDDGEYTRRLELLRAGR
jgi:putative membrane protein